MHGSLSPSSSKGNINTRHSSSFTRSPQKDRNTGSLFRSDDDDQLEGKLSSNTYSGSGTRSGANAKPLSAIDEDKVLSVAYSASNSHILYWKQLEEVCLPLSEGIYSIPMYST